MLQFDWTISLGQVLTMISILGTGLHLHKKIVVYDEQHKMIWRDYASRHGLCGKDPKPCAAHTHWRVGDEEHEHHRSGDGKKMIGAEP
jgi:hypothetical protein